MMKLVVSMVGLHQDSEGSGLQVT